MAAIDNQSFGSSYPGHSDQRSLEVDEEGGDYWDELSFLEAVEDINSTIAVQKTTAQGKSEIFRLLRRIIFLYHNLESRNAVLEMENKLLREGRTSRTTYVKAGATSPKLSAVTQRVNRTASNKKHQIFITSTEGKTSKTSGREAQDKEYEVHRKNSNH